MRRFLLVASLIALVAGVVSGAGIAGRPGTGLPVDPVRLSFDRVLVGTNISHGVTVTNSTNSPISYATTSRTGSAAFYLAGYGGECLTVQSGDTCLLSTGFNPTETGHFRATMTATFNTGPGQTVQATWSASGGAYMPKGGF